MNRRRRRIIPLPLDISGSHPGPGPTPGPESGAQGRFVAQALIEPSAGPGWCLAWVENVFDAVFGWTYRRETAYLDWKATDTWSSRDNIPKGAVVYGTGLNSNGAGHIGIYLGGGKVRDNQASNGVGVVVTSTLDQWISWQTDTIEGRTGYLGWGWLNNVNLEEVQ